MEVPNELLPGIASCLGGAPVARLGELCQSWRAALMTSLERAVAARAEAVASGGNLWGFLEIQDRVLAILESLPLMTVPSASHGFACNAESDVSEDVLCGQVVVRKGATLAQSTKANSTSRWDDISTLPQWIGVAAGVPPGLQLQPINEDVVDVHTFLRAVRVRCAGGGSVGTGAAGLALLLLARLLQHSGRGGNDLHFLHSRSQVVWVGADHCIWRAVETVWSVHGELLDIRASRPVELAAMVEYVVTSADYPSTSYHTPLTAPGASPQKCALM